MPAHPTPALWRHARGEEGTGIRSSLDSCGLSLSPTSEGRESAGAEARMTCVTQERVYVRPQEEFHPERESYLLNFEFDFWRSMRSLAFRNAAVPDRLRCLLPRSSAKVRAKPPRLPEWEEFPSLVPETLHEMSEDEELTQLHADVIALGQLALTEKEDTIRREMLDRLGVASFAATCAEAGVTPLRRAPASILQLNIGLYCNQACRHCHVESSPKRTEMMSHEVARRCIELLDSSSTVETLDLTGGAPELCPEFAYLVKEATARGVQVIDRCNLTVLVEPGQEGLAGFLAENKVRVVASLPCYSKENVDSQRGGGVFARSIRGLQLLNEVGYGVPGSGLTLDLVYNPGGVFLAPPSSSLECAYKDELKEAYGITFNSLLCLNNMPIKRWSDELVRMGKLDEYMELLVGAFNPAAAEGLMCRATASIGWSGEIYDCDFNQQLGLAVSGPARTVFDLGSLDELNDNRIVVASHCWGCTAGNGSGCQGGLDA